MILWQQVHISSPVTKYGHYGMPSFRKQIVSDSKMTWNWSFWWAAISSPMNVITNYRLHLLFYKFFNIKFLTSKPHDKCNLTRPFVSSEQLVVKTHYIFIDPCKVHSYFAFVIKKGRPSSLQGDQGILEKRGLMPREWRVLFALKKFSLIIWGGGYL